MFQEKYKEITQGTQKKRQNMMEMLDLQLTTEEINILILLG